MPGPFAPGIYKPPPAPPAGALSFGEWQSSDGDGGYYSGRQSGPSYDDRWNLDYLWGDRGNKNPVPLPANADPVHYQMRVQMGTDSRGRCEGGSAGNVSHVVMTVGATEYDVWANGPTWGPFRSGPLINVNGGEQIALARYDTIPGMNTAFFQGIVAYFDFVLK
jgi:hypothetical protein